MMILRFIKPVYAHCDVPCGIYETDTMVHAAATCARMVEKIEALGELDTHDKHANFVRCVNTKEKHAQKVKDELYLLWSDYFKPEHLEKYSNLHDVVWLAVKQASKVKQTVSAEECQKLVDAVHEVAHIFAESKQ
jgi:nickel superoxide dismutase